MKAARFAGMTAALAMALCAGTAQAADISTKKLQVKMHEDAAKKQFQAFSVDDTVQYEDAVAPKLGDHWHAAYGIYVFDTFMPPLSDTV